MLVQKYRKTLTKLPPSLLHDCTIGLLIGLVAILYCGTAKLGLLMAFQAEQITVVWPPTGLALAALLLLKTRVWPGIWLGAFLANITSHETFLTAGAIATGNTLEALAGAWILQRCAGFDIGMGRVRDIVGLMVAALFSAPLSAAIGVASLCLSDTQPWPAFGSLWLLWWLGDATSILLFAPLVLAWVKGDKKYRPKRRLYEYFALIAGITAVATLVFNDHQTFGFLPANALIYLIFPFIIWASIRFGQRGTTLITLITTIAALWATTHRDGPFTLDAPENNLALLQIFLTVVSVTGLVLSAAIFERHEAERTKARLAAIVASTRDAIIGKDLQGTINFWNEGAERLFGYKAEEAIGQPISLIVPPELQNEELDLLQYLQRGEYIQARETVRIDRQGHRLDVSLVVSPIYDDTGSIIGVSKIARDISERKKIEQSLKEADLRKNEFLAMLAHELRNPLAPLSNALQILKMPEADANRRMRAMEIMERQLRHIVRLVDDLIDISRISRGKIELRKQRIKLADVLTSSLETAQTLIAAKNHTLSTQLPDETVWLNGDPVRLAQVCANLLHNAAKYTAPGGHIWFEARVEEQTLILRVRDSGIGIPPHLLPIVFDMFVQLEQASDRAHEGLGVGLKLAKIFVELHEGTITAASSGAGCGSEFTVRIPILSTSPREPVPAPPQEGNTHATLRKLKVLVVDDHKTLAETLGWMVEALGHEVQLAYNGASALALADSFQPDVILLDIGLGGMSGYEVCQRLRANPALKHCLIVAQTGWSQLEHRRRSLAAGFDYHLVKPVHVDTLEELLTKQAKMARL